MLMFKLKLSFDRVCMFKFADMGQKKNKRKLRLFSHNTLKWPKSNLFVPKRLRWDFSINQIRFVQIRSGPLFYVVLNLIHVPFLTMWLLLEKPNRNSCVFFLPLTAMFTSLPSSFRTCSLQSSKNERMGAQSSGKMGNCQFERRCVTR